MLEFRYQSLTLQYIEIGLLQHFISLFLVHTFFSQYDQAEIGRLLLNLLKNLKLTKLV